ncbi:MAG: aminoacyl-tRNA hydrolase [Bacteroidota bacterium]
MKCIVGLGNPGDQYRMTRHNVGFLAVEYMMEKLNARHIKGTDDYECYEASFNEVSLLFLLPQAYMNNSGIAVRDIMQEFSIVSDDVLVIYDDFQLPYGTLRLRKHGSDGGHNGLASIIYQLQTDEISRLRVGVGGSTLPIEHTHESMADYVLSPFTKEEQKLLSPLLNHLHDACIMWSDKGIQRTMNMFNKNFFSSASAE